MARASRAMPSLGRIALLVAPPGPGLLADLGREELGFVEALSHRGFAVERIPWDSQEDWSRFRCVIIRETWDYYLRPDEYLDALAGIERQTALWNPADMVRWNSDKGYLLDLIDWDLSVVPTTILESGFSGETLATLGLDHAVVKPAVSASAYKTFLVDRRDPVAVRHAAHQLAGVKCLVQPFVSSIRGPGETSLVYFNARFSHALRKRPAGGDFRVQEELGGRTELVEASSAERQLAEAVLSRLPVTPLYARIDLVGWEGKPAVLEAELIEPVLYVAKAQAAEAFAQAVVERMG